MSEIIEQNVKTLFMFLIYLAACGLIANYAHLSLDGLVSGTALFLAVRASVRAAPNHHPQGEER